MAESFEHTDTSPLRTVRGYWRRHTPLAKIGILLPYGAIALLACIFLIGGESPSHSWLLGFLGINLVFCILLGAVMMLVSLCLPRNPRGLLAHRTHYPDCHIGHEPWMVLFTQILTLRSMRSVFDGGARWRANRVTTTTHPCREAARDRTLANSARTVPSGGWMARQLWDPPSQLAMTVIAPRFLSRSRPASVVSDRLQA